MSALVDFRGKVAADEAKTGRAALEYEALISHAPNDRPWAERLRSELEGRGIRVATFDLGPVEFDDALRRALERPATPALIVLWTPTAVRDARVLLQVNAFASLSRGLVGREAPVIPLYFGGDLAVAAPESLQGHLGVVLDSSVYDSGVGDDAPEEARAKWEEVVARIAKRLDPPPAAKPAETSFEKVRQRFRVSLAEGQHGWLLGEDLAVVRTEAELPAEVSVLTAAGEARATVCDPPRDAPLNRLDGFVLLRFDSPPRLSDPLPVRLPLGELPIEIWGESLYGPSARGEIGLQNDDDSLDLLLHHQQTIENGSAVWSPALNGFVGIAVYAGGRRWRLLPVEVMRRLAGKARPPVSPSPPSARIHDDGWTTNDCLDYSLYATAIGEFIHHPDTRAPLVIGIQGPWGQGKTSLMRLAQERLDRDNPELVKHRERVEEPPDRQSELTFGDLRESLDGDVGLDGSQPAEARTVWFNPWKYQSSEALWAGLANAILGQLPARLPRRQRELFWLQLQARRIDVGAVRRDIHRLVFDRLLPWLVASLLIGLLVAGVCVAAGVAAVFTALGSVAAMLGSSAISGAVAYRRALNRKLEGNYLRYVSQPDYTGKLGYFHYVEEDMRRALDLLAPADEPTVIFIDDLDRCSASRIGEVLEAINLFLSGEYPNCFFVLGIDAQVVASAMETIHRAALGEDEGEPDDVKGHLGWRFLDKFIQLSFVMPRISEEQRAAYLESLLGLDASGDGEETPDEAEKVLRQVRTRDLDPARASAELGEMRAGAQGAESKAVRQVAEEVIVQGARDFRDTDPETVKALEDQLPYLSDNPRTIKRAVNLYRFYHFISWARDASAASLKGADHELIADWTVIAARWPQAVHWLQVNGRDAGDPQAELLRALREDEPDLGEFLEGRPDLDLKRAMACGLW